MSLKTHEDYFATIAPDVRLLMEQIQAEIERVVPDAERCISYQMPAFRKGKVFLYFAAFNKHIGVYPPVDGPTLVAELTPYRGPKGNLIFPLSQPLPIDLIGRCAAALAAQYGK
jgi:uncharacterized protein YdhG (YjbR/CyaY superfamily)